MFSQSFPIPTPDPQAEHPAGSPLATRQGSPYPGSFGRPIATLVILAINGLIFGLMLYAGALKNEQLLLDFGASYSPYLRRGEYWRLVMPMFIHLGWLHLLVNSYALYILGNIVERVYGYGRFALLYVAMGIGGSLLSVTMSPNVVAAGASGAIFGIAGVMLVTGFLHRDVVPPHWGRAFGIGILPFIIVNLLFGFSMPGIDNWCHLGGLFSGMLLAGLIPPPKAGHAAIATGPYPAPEELRQQPSQAIVVVPLAVVIMAMGATVEHYRTSTAVNRLLVEGTRLRVAHQEDRAVERFQQAARLAPRDERPHELLGALYLEQKQFDKAVQEFEQAVQLSPGRREPRLGLGMAYYMKGDPRRAQQNFEAVLGRNPQNAEGQRLLADLYAEQKLYAEAIQHYQEALRLQDDMAVAHNNLAWLYATSEDAKFRDPGAALEHARRAVELTHWKEAGFVDTLAEAYFANKNFQEAVRTQVKALQLDPDNQELQEHMARYRKAAGSAA